VDRAAHGALTFVYLFETTMNTGAGCLPLDNHFALGL
jgi:hypothetical protein